MRAVRGGQSGPLDNSVIVADHTPSDGASGVAIDTVVTVTFNKSMDRTSTEAAFSITPSVSGAITWTDDDKTLTFTPAANLSPGVEYTVSIASSATDTGGHKLDSNKNGTGGEPEDTYTFPLPQPPSPYLSPYLTRGRPSLTRTPLARTQTILSIPLPIPNWMHKGMPCLIRLHHGAW